MEISLFLQLTVLSVIISFVLIQILDNKENLYLNATNPGSKKLMVVDQQTGAISFLNESVQGIDQAFATSDSTTNALLKALFGEEMDATSGTFATKLAEQVTARGVVAARVEAIDTSLDARITALENSAVRNGDIIALGRNGDNGCGGRGCRGVVGLKQRDKAQGSEEAKWVRADFEFDHVNGGSTIKIWREKAK
tara:strand:+ start:12502 stop:13086 length:585 start_codon:yes stop_codon:yes gene_type:complete